MKEWGGCDFFLQMMGVEGVKFLPDNGRSVDNFFW